MQTRPLRIGTRGSQLALVQAETVRAGIAAVAGPDTPLAEIVPIRTSGDNITDRPLTEAGGKGLFTKEIDDALLDGRVDIGVHSAKDMATRMPDGIVIAACLPRADVRDAFVSPVARTLADLPDGAIVGTSSLRRRALVLMHRPGLRIVDLRGNVDTRLRRIEEGRAQATVLAAAGLIRLGLTDRAASWFDPETWIPAPGQGAIAIAARANDEATRALVARLDHRPTSIALAAERAYLAVLDGSCRTPIGGYATVAGETLSIRGIILKLDGSVAHQVTKRGEAHDAEAIGRDAGADLARRGGVDFFAG